MKVLLVASQANNVDGPNIAIQEVLCTKGHCYCEKFTRLAKDLVFSLRWTFQNVADRCL
jgi:hypothetical protein